MATTNLDAVDMRNAQEGGVIHEDVMNRIYEIDPEDRPFVDSIQADTAQNAEKEFVQEILEDSNMNNAYVDGQSLAGLNDTRLGNRYSNFCQQMVKVVRVSVRAREVNSIGTNDQKLWQLMRRQKAIRRDEESALTGINGAQHGDGNEANADTTGPGVLAGLASWIRTNTDRGVGGANAVLSGAGGIGGYPKTTGAPPTNKDEWVGITPGNKRALAESMIKSMMRACFNAGGNPRLLISIPDIIELISDYLLTAQSRVATIQTNVAQGNRTDNATGGGISGGGVVAQGSVNLFVTNFGTLELCPDRFQKRYTAADTGDVANVFIVDPDWFARAYLSGYHTRDLAKEGLADNSYIRADVTLCAMAENSSACIADINPAVAMVP